LYKKTRSVERNADSALHSIPSPGLYLSTGNILWAICFGWWLAMISYIVSIILFLTPFGGWKYAKVLRELSSYIFWPFGKFVEKDSDYLDNDEQQTDYFSHRGSSAISDIAIDDENRPLLGRSHSRNRSEKFDLFEKLDEIGLSGLVFYFWFFLVLGESL
jgi:Ca2+:H+ antiporter